MFYKKQADQKLEGKLLAVQGNGGWGWAEETSAPSKQKFYFFLNDPDYVLCVRNETCLSWSWLWGCWRRSGSRRSPGCSRQRSPRLWRCSARSPGNWRHWLQHRKPHTIYRIIHNNIQITLFKGGNSKYPDCLCYDHLVVVTLVQAMLQ